MEVWWDFLFRLAASFVPVFVKHLFQKKEVKGGSAKIVGVPDGAGSSLVTKIEIQIWCSENQRGIRTHKPSEKRDLIS